MNEDGCTSHTSGNGPFKVPIGFVHASVYLSCTNQVFFCPQMAILAQEVHPSVHARTRRGRQAQATRKVTLHCPRTTPWRFLCSWSVELVLSLATTTSWDPSVYPHTSVPVDGGTTQGPASECHTPRSHSEIVGVYGRSRKVTEFPIASCECTFGCTSTAMALWMCPGALETNGPIVLNRTRAP